MLPHPFHLHIRQDGAETPGPVECEAGGRKRRLGPRGPPERPQPAPRVLNPVFTPALPLTPFFVLWCLAASGCQPIERVFFVQCLFHAQRLLLFFAHVICLKGAPWL